MNVPIDAYPSATQAQDHELSPSASVEGLFRELGPYVFRALRGLGVPDADVDDAVQEVFVVVHRRLGDFEGRSSVRTWIYGIAVRVAANHRTRARARREFTTDDLPEIAVDATQLDALLEEDARAALGRILDHLEADKRAVFVLYELEELSMKEIADALQCPVQTAYSRLHAARASFEAAVRRLRARSDA